MGRSSRKKGKASERIKAGQDNSKSADPHDNTRLLQSPLIRATRKSTYFLAISISLITFLVYLSSLQNEFVNWDDDHYVLDNPYIRLFNMDFFRWTLFTFYAGNWHPLTWISHAIDYSIWGLNPLGHHLTNSILHALNTVMVVLLVRRLMDVARKTAAMNEPSEFL